MQIKGKLPLLIIAVLAWIVIISSCANQGMPTGGPRDSIPPMLVETSPAYKALNYKGDNVSFTFNEYIISSGVSEALVISPPLEKRPTIRTKGKSLVIQFNEELKDSATYSLDFKNSIVDNNEKNPYENMRFAFSTGDIFDSLRVAGRVMNSFNLEPFETSLVILHENLHDSAIYKVRPSYIAKTDEAGLFMIDNIAPGTYNIFSIIDANNDLMYNEGSEEIAFHDTLIVPSVEYHEERDTLSKGVDSMMILGHTHFYPDPVYLRAFMEEIYDQYLETYERISRYECKFVFNEPVDDTFNIRLLDNSATDWYIMENNEEMDSVGLWISDTTVATLDTLFMEVSYFLLDSAAQLYVQKDTLELNFRDRVEEKTKKKKRSKKEDEEEKPKPIPQFIWDTNLEKTMELNGSISLTAPQPINPFDSTQLVLYLTEDTLKTPLEFSFRKDTSKWRSFVIDYNWQPEANYTFEIDSAVCENIYGLTSKRLNKKFSVREEDYYGTVLVKLESVECPMVVQLLKNNEGEEVISERETDKSETVIFDFVAPGKYKIKVIYDENGNGKWDSGSFQDKLQAEKVAYINVVEKVRSNFDSEITWDLDVDLTFTKNIRDFELEEEERKEAEEDARKERENPQREQMQNSMMQGSGSGGRNIMRK